ncbi:MAG: DUF3043 domain-containing protein [Actinobacteria bacterium]|uniref:Unannotated protein n=1 Tax=freshwater metagenome TaxID=449393 RepID=A0A6J6MZT7_9ZZZZ|nr:DUF3043 domain-containing protein [Actinomycetota bacterium]
MSDQDKESVTKSSGKGRPTPTRKEREAANLKPLVGNKSKEAMVAARAKQREDRLKVRQAMLSGEEKYLLGRDRGPQRRLARDVIDNRYTLIEGLMPLMVLFLLITSATSDSVKNIITLVMIIALITVTIEVSLLHRIIKSRIKEKLGADTKIQKGTWFYVFTRGMQPRPLRIPKPGPRRKTK